MTFLAHIKKWVRPRYSLRTAFILTSVFSVVTAGLAVTHHEAQRQQQVMARLHQKTCVMECDAGPEWLPESFDIGQLRRVKRILIGEQEVPELAELSGLTCLLTRGSNISELGPLAGLRDVQYLQVGNTQVSDLSPLREWTRLESLFLEDTPVSDIAPLAGLHSLKVLDLSGTEVKDLSPLKGLVNLEELTLYDTPVDPAKIDALRKLLPNCEIYTY